MNALEFSINGRTHRETNASPNTTLLNWLRSRGLTGTKEGCAEGDCGACTVVLVDPGTGSARAVNSCLLLLPMVHGKEVFTVEGLAKGNELHPAQAAMSQRLGSQCGYCTPGVVMSLAEACHRSDLDEEWKLDDQMAGNLCRCTGYHPIRDALTDVAASMPDDLIKLSLKRSAVASELLTYSVHSEKWFTPTSTEELFGILSREPNALIISGGTDLALEVTKRFKRFETVVSLDGLRALQTVTSAPEGLQIGAGVRLSDLEANAAAFPPIERMLRFFGARQIKNRATVGGNLCTASPIGDLAPVLLSLDASAQILGPEGSRTIPLSEFFVGYRKTALAPSEILGGLFVPALSQTARACAYKVSKRQELDISAVSAGLRVELEEGLVTRARFAFGGLAAMPARALRTEALAVGKPWTEASILALQAELRHDFRPIDDHRGSAWYRMEVASNLLMGFFHETHSVAQPRLTYRPTSTLTVEHRDVPAASEKGAGAQSIRRVGEELETPLGAPLEHESAGRHVTGSALYVDDLPAPATLLVGEVFASPAAHARILRLDVTRARTLPGVHAVLTAADIPGVNDIAPFTHDEPLLATREVHCVGQSIALVVAESHEACRAAQAAIELELEALPAILTLRDAIAQASFMTDPHVMRRGDVAEALSGASLVLEGIVETGGQDHFYLETHASLATPLENDCFHVAASSQAPTEVQAKVAEVLGIPRANVVVEVPRMGGGFGGKETQGAHFAALAALGARATGRPVKVWLNRDQDMTQTGKRHPFFSKYRAGFDKEGHILGVDVEIYSDGGWSQDLSAAILDRALFHLDNAYYLPALRFSGRVARTHTVSNTAFRGFGGPQGMVVIETIMNRAAEALGLDPLVVRARNYYGDAPRNRTPYDQNVPAPRIGRITDELAAKARYAERRAEIERDNATRKFKKRGLALAPVKFGISFTNSMLNQAGAFVIMYADGTVQLNHGGTEMGQGLHTKMLAVLSHELGVLPTGIRVMHTATDKVPNTSATAASSGSDLNGQAVKDAATQIRRRLAPVAARLLGATTADRVRFAGGFVSHPDSPDRIPISKVANAAYVDQVPMFATGFYKTPGIFYDKKAGRGNPFYYYAYGAAVIEVEVDGLTGEHRVLAIDVLHDVGDSLVPTIDRGQIEGALVQGLGWLTREELVWSSSGQLKTHSPDTYKIPAFGDAPLAFRVDLLEAAHQDGVIHGSKAVGEPPFMLAIGVITALEHALQGFGVSGSKLKVPATPEAVLRAIRA